jgi:hypothetical protein
MIRTRIKGTGIKAASSPDTEPNFYQMEYCPTPSNSSCCYISVSLPSTPTKSENCETPSQGAADSVRSEDSLSVKSPETPMTSSDGHKKKSAATSNRSRVKTQLSKNAKFDNRKRWKAGGSNDIPAFVELITTNFSVTENSRYCGMTPKKNTGSKAASSPHTEPILCPMEHPDNVFGPRKDGTHEKDPRTDTERSRRNSSLSLKTRVTPSDGNAGRREGVSNHRRLKARISTEVKFDTQKSWASMTLGFHDMPCVADDSSIHSHSSTLKWFDSYFSTAEQDVCDQLGDKSNGTLNTDADDAFTNPAFVDELKLTPECSIPTLNDPFDGGVAFLEGKPFSYLERININSLEPR